MVRNINDFMVIEWDVQAMFKSSRLVFSRGLSVSSGSSMLWRRRYQLYGHGWNMVTINIWGTRFSDKPHVMDMFNGNTWGMGKQIFHKYRQWDFTWLKLRNGYFTCTKNWDLMKHKHDDQTWEFGKSLETFEGIFRLQHRQKPMTQCLCAFSLGMNQY